MAIIRQTIMTACFIFAIAVIPLIGEAGEAVLVTGTPGSVYFLHKSPPVLQIGDNQGNMKDIEKFLAVYADTSGKKGDALTKFIGEKYVGRFILAVPRTGRITLRIFSLLEKNHPKWDCKTTLQVNDGKEFDLRENSNVGSRKMTMVSINTPFRVGENRVTIKEHDCSYTPNPALNDSLIFEIKVEF